MSELTERLRDHSWGKNVADTLEQWTRDRELAADTIEALSSKNEEQALVIRELVEALQDSQIAFNDWVSLYAPDECMPHRIEETRARIGKAGTLAYIAEVTDRNRAAIAKAST